MLTVFDAMLTLCFASTDMTVPEPLNGLTKYCSGRKVNVDEAKQFTCSL